MAGRIGAIVGPARSGTTWAGTLADSSPDVIYRFEPFRRLALVKPRFRRWFDELKQGTFRHAELADLYCELHKAHPFTHKPPFFGEKSYRQPTLCRQLLWPTSRVLPLVHRVYEAAYTPRAAAPIVFKEVTFIRPLLYLLEQTAIPVAYLVRHPCATVLSEVRGQQKGMMPSGRQANLRGILQHYRPSLAEAYPDVLAGNDLVKRIALLWRCEIEVCVPAVLKSAGGALFTYENLAMDTASEARRLLSHLGLAYSEQTQRYIELLQGIDGAGSARKRSGWENKYFSTYRNPAHQHALWKHKISPEDRKKIEDVLRGSDAFEKCAAQGNWD